MKINTANKNIFLVGFIGFVLGLVVMFFISRGQVQSQKKLTVRILTNSIQSMEASQHLSESCSNAYNTIAACVSSLKSCNIDEEAKKLDTFDSIRKNSDKEIEKANTEMKKIIEEVKANQ